MGLGLCLRRTRREKDVEILTDQRRIFVDEYLSCWNKTEAARIAGYKHPRRMGSRLTKVDIIRDLIQQRLDENAMTANEVLFRLGQQARSDVTYYIDATTERVFLLNMERIKKRGHLIKKIKYTMNGPEIEVYSSQKALELIGKHHRLFVDKVEYEGEICLIFDAPVPAVGTEETEKT